MKITQARIYSLACSLFLTMWAGAGLASKDLEPSKHLLAQIHEMDVQPGDTLIDSDGRRYKVKGFAKNKLIATEQGKWVRSLSKIAIAKGSRNGFQVGDSVYNEKSDKKHTGRILGFYADDTLAWDGPNLRIKIKKLRHLEMSSGPSLITRTNCQVDCQMDKQF